ncbi:vWA domain-containing protein [Desulfatibacillum aliphaticivorans]|uniref:vWA domain-containing protein n=1 Tax=Desulfatibacillum aliphaticivorans TaxID=218208 RepID=UPI0004061510|nr:vWA domain-containing protein [Desulfatibacillum aliphaticivorans]
MAADTKNINSPADSALNPEDEGLSSFWRKNVSGLEAVELANILRALRKVAGHMGPNVGRIEYTGMSHGSAASIIIDPELVMGEYPAPPHKVDYLTGLVVHEALHKIEWSEKVWKTLAPDFSAMPGLSRIAFQKIIHTGEDVYVDRLADRSILGRYAARTRSRAIEDAKTRLSAEKPTLEHLIHLWWASVWSPQIFERAEARYLPALKILQNLTASLESLPDETTSIIKRCQGRADLYKTAWENLEAEVQGLFIQDKRLIWLPDSAVSVNRDKEEDFPDPSPRKGLNNALLRDVEANLAQSSADITPIIRSIVGPDNLDVAPISRWDFNMAAHPVIDRKTVGRLKAIFANYADRKKIMSRGLTGGRVDGRKLYRAPINGRCFRQTDSIPSMDWNVTLLLDATGSMRGGKWRMVENTVGAMHKALAGFQNRLGAWAYFEIGGICMMSRLISGRNLLSVPPSGQTASGQAIIAAAYFMPKDKRRKLLVHVTDGQSNFGVDVSCGIDYCMQQNINLVTIGCGVRDRAKMEEQYGRTIQFVSHFGQLPMAMEKLLKWSFLYGDGKKLTAEARLRRLFVTD